MFQRTKIFTLRNPRGGLSTVTVHVADDDRTATLADFSTFVSELCSLFNNAAGKDGFTIEHECFVGGLPAASEN